MSTMTVPATTVTRSRRATAPVTTPASPAGPTASDAEDFRLLDAYLAGDHFAFQELVNRHQQRVYAVSYRYFGDHGDAQDATQDAFIAMARHADTIRGTARLSTWLHRVTINACHDIARRRARRPQPTHREPVDVAESVDRVGQRETELDVQAALATLDPVSRALLILVAIEDRSYAEAAEILGLSVPATKSRIHRARARVADVLRQPA